MEEEVVVGSGGPGWGQWLRLVGGRRWWWWAAQDQVTAGEEGLVHGQRGGLQEEVQEVEEESNTSPLTHRDNIFICDK